MTIYEMYLYGLSPDDLETEEIDENSFEDEQNELHLINIDAELYID